MNLAFVICMTSIALGQHFLHVKTCFSTGSGFLSANVNGPCKKPRVISRAVGSFCIVEESL